MIRATRFALLLLAVAVLHVSPLLGQQGAAADTRSPEERLRAVETEQQYMRQALKDNQDTTRIFFTGLGVLLVLIQVISSVVQARRENQTRSYQAKREDELEERSLKHESEVSTSRQQREDELEVRRSQRESELETSRRQREDNLMERSSQREQQLLTFWTERENQLDQRRSQRDDRLDTLTGSSVESVRNVLDVVYKTFEERRQAEKEDREAKDNFNNTIKELTGTIDKLNAKIRDLEGFAAGVRRTVENEQHALERRALGITKITPRHVFRSRSTMLAEFAREYDSFLANQGLPETTTENGAGLTIYASYIRGIAAHYGDDSKLATVLLNRVATEMTVQPGEDAAQRDKRRAVAYYYVGITDSNFGSYDAAIEAFQHAIDLETSPKDVLSRLVAAEAAAFGNRAIDTQTYLGQIDGILKELNDQHTAAKTQLPLSFRRQGYRATLIRANIAIAKGRDHWKGAIDLLRDIPDPHEYYASSTLAQILQKQDPASKQAKDLFQNSYSSIRDLGHLHAVAEVRSKVLLLLVAGLCAQNADGYATMAEEHFAEAEGLLPNLPELDGHPCTVFSPLIKRNVEKSAIINDIDALRRGSVLTEA